MADVREGKSDQGVPLNPKYMFGSPEELANRAGPTGYAEDKDPEDNAPSFEQIKPSTGRQNINEVQSGEHRSGDFKFSGGVK